MFSSIRSKLIGGFLGVSFLVGAVSLIVGGRLLYKAVLNEATNRIRLDLNTAREIYHNRVRGVEVVLDATALGSGFRSDLKIRDRSALINRLRQLARYAELDFAGIVTTEGATLCRIGPHPIPTNKTQVPNPLANLALRQGVPISGTVVLSFFWPRTPESLIKP
jgi:two-component system NtrC family sensor kinase